MASQISFHRTLIPGWLDGFLIMNKSFDISIFDGVILLLRVVSRTAAFGDVTAEDMINVVVVLRVHACMHKEVLLLSLQ